MIDALRGFAVMAILLVHSLEHFLFPVYPDPALQPAWLNALDSGIFDFTFALFAGKAYAIFALLFGFTYHIQYTNRQARGRDFGWRFVWRLALLAGFATLNAAFFPGGDVLMLFAIVGLILPAVRKLGNRGVLIIALVLLLQPVEWFHYLASLFSPSYTIPDLGIGTLYGTVAEATRSGNFGEFVAVNVTTGQKASLLWAVGAGRVTQTAGLFLLGMLLGRRGLFAARASLVAPAETPQPAARGTKNPVKFWLWTLIGGAVAFCPLYSLHELVMEKGGPVVQQTVGTAFDMWQKFAFTAVLVASFVLLYHNAPRFVRLAAPLRFYGRMSLSNYVAQSIIGALIYFPFALHLAPYCGYTASLLIGVAVLCIQVMCCRWWLHRHKQGPLEGLWHRLTWPGTRN